MPRAYHKPFKSGAANRARSDGEPVDTQTKRRHRWRDTGPSRTRLHGTLVSPEGLCTQQTGRSMACRPCPVMLSGLWYVRALGVEL